jgi:hypothetical protein
VQWVEEAEMDSIELICRIDVKHKARNNNVNGSSVIVMDAASTRAEIE